MTKHDDIHLDDAVRPEEAAEIIKQNTGKSISISWIRDLCAEGRLKAKKVGPIWFIDRTSVEKFERNRPGVKAKRKI